MTFPSVRREFIFDARFQGAKSFEINFNVPDFINNHSDTIFDNEKSPEELILELHQEISDEDGGDDCKCFTL